MFQSAMVASNDSEKRKKRKVRSDSTARTLALEQAYVHDVYSFIASKVSSASSPVHSHVKQFIVEEFEPGSVLLDIGCSDGKHLNLSPDIVVIGLEHCGEWFQSDLYKLDSHSKHLVLGDLLYLPFRDDFFDGVLCCSVLHHISTLERRINALKEIARILKIGGKLLLTVSSGPCDVKEVESQDVLIRVEHNCKTFNSAALNGLNTGCEVDSKSYSNSDSSNSSSTNSSIELNVYENCTSPTSSEFENCYSFVKKALKRFSLTSSIYSMKNSSLSDGSSKSRFSANLSMHDEVYPIELCNLEEDSCSSRSSSSTGDSALSSFNRSSGCISQSSSNNIFPSSLISVIKEHLISWKVQFTNTMAWYSLDPKTSPLVEAQKNGNGRFESEQQNHRFSLPISFRKITKTDSSRNILNKNKVYASNGMSKPRFHDFALDGVVKQVELNLTQTIRPKQAQGQAIDLKSSSSIEPQPTTTSEHCNMRISKKNMQKSFSSESSRQTSFECSGYKLIAYYSMPELRTLESNHGTDSISCRTLREVNKTSSVTERLHSLETIIDFNARDTTDLMDSNLPSESKEYLLDDEEEEEIKLDNELNAAMPPASASPASVTSDITKDCEIEGSIEDEMADNPSTLQQANSSKFPKKLLRQRSFSADYQQETVKFQPELPRRFSASPNIGTHRYNNNDHTPHQQQISIDSEESFVTIIPAIRSTRDSIADTINTTDNLTDFELEEEEDSAEDISPNSYSSDDDGDDDDDDDDDAYCENLSNNEQTSEDNTSMSSVLEATIRSVSKSDSKDSNADHLEELPLECSQEEMSARASGSNSNSTVQSPPTTLHRYYHLFRGGELEHMIEEHVHNLHIIDSYYNELATSRCIVAEKIHVWTI